MGQDEGYHKAVCYQPCNQVAVSVLLAVSPPCCGASQLMVRATRERMSGEETLVETG